MLTLLLMACIENQFHAQPEKVWVGDAPNLSLTEEKVDTFKAPTEKPVDILFAIDQSCSMWDDRFEINESIPYFFSLLKTWNINYRVALMSLDSRDGVGGMFALTPSGQVYTDVYSTDSVNDFERMGDMIRSYQGEEGIDSLVFSMRKSMYWNREFFRNAVPMHIVLISDENDSSKEYQAGQFHNFVLYEAQQKKNANISFSTIAILPTSDCSIVNVDDIGWEYIWLANQMYGTVHDICNIEWDKALEQIAVYSTTHDYEYILTDIPIEDSIYVEVEASGVTFVKRDWSYNEYRNSVSITDYNQNANEIVKIYYSIR